MDKIKELEQKANRTGQFHLDAINEKLANLKSEDTALFDKIDALEKKIDDNKDNSSSLINHIIDMNDGLEMSFEGIAEWIDENVEGIDEKTNKA